MSNAETLARVQMEPGWKHALEEQFLSSHMHELRAFLLAEKQAGKVIYPPSNEVFAAFNLTPLDAVKVVILGQDPYHGPRQAHGLCFSVRRGIAPPPSLENIFKEIQSDLGLPRPPHGELTYWAEQGVLLLNSVLSVEAGQAASHQGRGWETFTDAAIKLLNDSRNNLVFMLWGAYAQRKGRVIDANRHLVLTSAHPSPLAANRGGWFGCKHFSRANAYLQAHGQTPINWALPA